MKRGCYLNTLSSTQIISFDLLTKLKNVELLKLCQCYDIRCINENLNIKHRNAYSGIYNIYIYIYNHNTLNKNRKFSIIIS